MCLFNSVTFQNNLIFDKYFWEIFTRYWQTLEEANQFLKTYINFFNKQFAFPIDDNKSAMIKAPTQEEINIYLSRFSKRKTDSGSTITYYSKKYFPYKNNKVQYIQPRTDVIVLKSFINDLYLRTCLGSFLTYFWLN